MTGNGRAVDLLRRSLDLPAGAERVRERAGRSDRKKYENGRKNAVAVHVYVPDEIKAMLAEKAVRAGVTQTEFLCRLIREA